MIRVLHELAALDGGGDAKLLYSYYSNMDRDKVHFDFVIFDFYDEGIYEKPLRELGCTIHKIPRIKRDKMGYLRGMQQIIENGNYDVVHSHMGGRSLFTMFFARRYGVKRRIAHSHVAYEPVTKLKRCFNIGLCIAAKINATDLFACGRDAGIYMWGKRCSQKGKVRIMTNAVDTELFAFSQKLREEKRRELQVEDKYVIGIVGRLEPQKNYPFLLDVYKELLKTSKDVVLVAVGRGQEKEEEAIKQYGVSLGIDDQIRYLGVRSDVPQLLNAFDLFVLPSLFEGLPVVLIEAQASGLRQIVSDKITREMNITDLIDFLPIVGTEKEWAQKIESYRNCQTNRTEYAKKVTEAGYDIKEASLRMQEFYLQ